MTEFKNGDKVQHKYSEGVRPYTVVGYTTRGTVVVESDNGYTYVWEKDFVAPYSVTPEIGATYKNEKGGLFHVLEVFKGKVFGRYSYSSGKWIAYEEPLSVFARDFPDKIDDDE